MQNIQDTFMEALKQTSSRFDEAGDGFRNLFRIMSPEPFLSLALKEQTSHWQELSQLREELQHSRSASPQAQSSHVFGRLPWPYDLLWLSFNSVLYNTYHIIRLYSTFIIITTIILVYSIFIYIYHCFYFCRRVTYLLNLMQFS